MIVGHDLSSKTFSVETPVLPEEPPFGLAIARAVQEKYFPMGAIGKMLNVRPETLDRVLGSVTVDVSEYVSLERVAFFPWKHEYPKQ